MSFRVFRELMRFETPAERKSRRAESLNGFQQDQALAGLAKAARAETPCPAIK